MLRHSCLFMSDPKACYTLDTYFQEELNGTTTILFVYRPTRIWYIKINNRSILGGITLASGTLLSLVTLLFIGLDKIYLHFKNGDLITLAIAYLLIPAVFIGICLYFIFNSRTMQTKEGKSVTAKLSAGLGLNLLIALPAFLYLLSVGTAQIPYVLFLFLLFLLLMDLLLTFLFAAYVLYSWMYQMIPLKKRLIISLFQVREFVARKYLHF